MPRGKQEINLKGKNIRKRKKVMFRIPKESYKQIQKQMNAMDIRGVQELFDYLVISGIVFRKPEVIELIRNNRTKYEEKRKQERLSRLKLAEKPEKVEMFERNVYMYHEDHVAFKDYVIEENITQQNIFNILFIDGFLTKEPSIISLIERAKELEVRSRKQNIARLSNDEYVKSLPLNDASLILDKLTEEYDKREFDPDLQKLVAEILTSEKSEDEISDDEVERALEEKLKRVRMSRAALINQIAKPREID